MKLRRRVTDGESCSYRPRLRASPGEAVTCAKSFFTHEHLRRYTTAPWLRHRYFNSDHLRVKLLGAEQTLMTLNTLTRDPNET